MATPHCTPVISAGNYDVAQVTDAVLRRAPSASAGAAPAATAMTIDAVKAALRQFLNYDDKQEEPNMNFTSRPPVLLL